LESSPLTDSAATLEHARVLAAARDWTALAGLAGGITPAALDQSPELGYLCADALNRTGATQRARDIAAAVEPAIRRAGERRLLLRLQNLVGVIAFEAGETVQSEAFFAQLLEDASRWQDDEFVARASNNLGVLANIRGRRELALTSYERALAAYQRLGHLRGLAQTHYNLGISYRDLARPEEADAHYSRAIHFADRSGSEDVIALAETERAALRIRGGDGSLADRWLGNAQARFERLGDPVRRAEVLRVRASAARLSGHTEAAREHLEEAFAVAQAHSNLLLHAEVQRDRGVLLRELQLVDEARAALLDAADHFGRLGADDDAAAARAAAGAAE
jgi:tetratricopeptide (TPR) repeat protein